LHNCAVQILLLNFLPSLLTSRYLNVMQEMADVEAKLLAVRREQLESQELELKAAQDRRLAIEDLEMAV